MSRLMSVKVVDFPSSSAYTDATKFLLVDDNTTTHTSEALAVYRNDGAMTLLMEFTGSTAAKRDIKVGYTIGDTKDGEFVVPSGDTVNVNIDSTTELDTWTAGINGNYRTAISFTPINTKWLKILILGTDGNTDTSIKTKLMFQEDN